jgi:homoserine acetyltransferase
LGSLGFEKAYAGLLDLIKHKLTLIDPENMCTMLYTWQAGDCSDQEPYNGDFSAAMKGIKAKALVLPGQTDLYFRE